MNLENYVCTLEQAKKLKALGVERESVFCWWKYAGSDEYDVKLYEYILLYRMPQNAEKRHMMMRIQIESEPILLISLTSALDAPHVIFTEQGLNK